MPSRYFCTRYDDKRMYNFSLLKESSHVPTKNHCIWACIEPHSPATVYLTLSQGVAFQHSYKRGSWNARGSSLLSKTFSIHKLLAQHSSCSHMLNKPVSDRNQLSLKFPCISSCHWSSELLNRVMLRFFLGLRVNISTYMMAIPTTNSNDCIYQWIRDWMWSWGY